MMEGTMMNGSMMSGYGMMFGGFMMIIVWGAIFYLVFSLIKMLFRKKTNTPHNSALDALNLRYANGEINATELETMKQNINNAK